MIQFKNISSEEPYLIFQDWYQEAVNAGQLRVQAIAISSYNADTELVDSRFVNLKYIDKDRWVFFSNYNGPKAQAFESNQSISALFYCCLLYTSPSPRDRTRSRMPSSA